LPEAIAQRCNLVPSEYAGELRVAFRSMSDKERNAALNQALQNNDGQLIASVCQAPGILSGLSDDVQARYVESLQERMAGDLLAEMADLDEALSTAEAARNAGELMVDANFNVAEQTAIDAAEAKAAAAERQLQETLSQKVSSG